MRSLVASASLLALGLFDVASAHVFLHNIYLNDVTPGDATCLRLVKDGNKRNFPVEDLTSDDMVCGRDGTEGVSRVCPANAGDKLTLGWGDWSDKPPKENYLDPSHKGPCSVMMKKVDSALTDSGKGGGWFRIFYEGFNKDTGKWCTERMFHEGKISVEIPKDLAGGDYLIRSELLALHSAGNANPNPQFYITCAQVFLKSGGSAIPKDTVSLPDGYVNMQNPAMTWSIYKGDEYDATYPDYGPATHKSTGETSGQGDQVQTEGLKPENCILQDGNWCGIEVPRYTTQAECWEVAKGCWAQADVCWKETKTYEGCKVWANRCESIADDCKNKRAGPQNHGQQLKYAGHERKASCPGVIGGSNPTNTESSGSTYEQGEPEERSEPSAASSSAPSSATESAAAPGTETSPSSDEEDEAEQKSPDSYGQDDSSATANAGETSPTTSPAVQEPAAPLCTQTVTDVVYETFTTTVTPGADATQAPVPAAQSSSSGDAHYHRMRVRHMH